MRTYVTRWTRREAEGGNLPRLKYQALRARRKARKAREEQKATLVAGHRRTAEKAAASFDPAGVAQLRNSGVR